MNRGRVAARKVKRAWILLQADAGEAGPGWPDEQIQQAYDVGLMTIHRVRQTLVEDGLAAVLAPRRQSRARRRPLDGDQEAQSDCLGMQPGSCGTPALDVAHCWPARWWS